jgi:hypothetical protein
MRVKLARVDLVATKRLPYISFGVLEAEIFFTTIPQQRNRAGIEVEL